MDYVTRVISEIEKDKIIAFYSEKQVENSGEYVVFAAKDNETNIFIYQSKKGYKVSFQGKNALYEASIFFEDATLKEKKEKVKTEFLDLSPQIGSDEVGTGDVFGPLVVTACYYDEDIEKDIHFKIDDSKKLSDKFILENIPLILSKLTFSKYTLTPDKYNEFIKKGYSMNSIKAILHNLALLSLSKKISYKHAYVDQFCEESLYYHYLKDEKNVLNNIIFLTKGESHYPSIALASMISRYSFLNSIEEMNNKYDFIFPLGAGKKVDEAIDKFIEKYGFEKLKEVAKCNFKNIKEKEALKLD